MGALLRNKDQTGAGSLKVARKVSRVLLGIPPQLPKVLVGLLEYVHTTRNDENKYTRTKYETLATS